MESVGYKIVGVSSGFWRGQGRVLGMYTAGGYALVGPIPRISL